MSNIDQLALNIYQWLIQRESVEGLELAQDQRIVIGTSKGDLRPSNQDRVLFVEIAKHASFRGPLCIALVADGMGGMADGSAAASMAAATFCACIALDTESRGLKSLVVAAIHAANDSVHARWRGRAGSTLTAAVWATTGCVGIHAGDSRIYVSNKKGLTVLTRDDTIAALAGQHRNSESSSEIYKHDNRLVQFVGVGNELVPHLIDLNPYWQEADDQVLMLSTDGAHFAPESNIASCFTQALSLSLASSILSVSREAGSDDNASLIITKMKIDPERIDLAGADIRISAPGHVFTGLNLAGNPDYPEAKTEKPKAEIPKRKQKVKSKESSSDPIPSDKAIKPKAAKKRRKSIQNTPNLFDEPESVIMELIDAPSERQKNESSK